MRRAPFDVVVGGEQAAEEHDDEAREHHHRAEAQGAAREVRARAPALAHRGAALLICRWRTPLEEFWQ